MLVRLPVKDCGRTFTWDLPVIGDDGVLARDPHHLAGENLLFSLYVPMPTEGGY